MFWAKIFQTRHDTVLAVCDENIVGKTLKKGKFEFKISENFYKQKLVSEEIVLKLMNKASIGNIVGKEIVKIAKQNGFISNENIIHIDGIPHAQFVKIEL